MAALESEVKITTWTLKTADGGRVGEIRRDMAMGDIEKKAKTSRSPEEYLEEGI